MSEPKINIIKADSFKEAYDVVSDDEVKDQIEEHTLGYYSAEIEKLIQSFNPKDTAFIINALRLELIALECAIPEEYHLAYQMLPEEALPVVKYAVQEYRKYDRNQN